MNIPQLALSRLLSDEPVPPKKCSECPMVEPMSSPNVSGCKLLCVSWGSRPAIVPVVENDIPICHIDNWKAQAQQAVEEMRQENEGLALLVERYRAPLMDKLDDLVEAIREA